MLNKFIAAVVFAFSLVLCQSALAGHARCGEGLKHMVDALQLDQAQKDKVKPILEQLKANMKENGPQMMDLCKQINEQSMSANMDQAAVDGMIDKKVKMMGDMMKAKVSAKNQIFSILNDQQKAKLQAKMKMMQEKMHAKMKQCHGED